MVPHYGTARKAVAHVLIQTVLPRREMSMVSPEFPGILKALIDMVDMDQSRLMTDELAAYKTLGRKFKGGHGSVKHRNKEYARGDVHCNSAESYFALLKRGIHGTFHHVGKQHLHRYADEFCFRWNHRETTDAERTEAALRLSPGTRLLYKERKISA